MPDDELFKQNKSISAADTFDVQQAVQTQQTTLEANAAQVWQEHRQASHDFLRNKRKTLFVTRKDSKEMDSVKTKLLFLNGLFALDKPLEADKVQEHIRECTQAYTALLQSCQNYIDKKGNPLTDVGKSRLAMVKQLKAQAERELQAMPQSLTALAQQSKATGQSYPLSYLFYQMRSYMLSGDNLTAQPVGTDGSLTLQHKTTGNTLRFRPVTQTPGQLAQQPLRDYTSLADEYIQSKRNRARYPEAPALDHVYAIECEEEGMTPVVQKMLWNGSTEYIATVMPLLLETLHITEQDLADDQRLAAILSQDQIDKVLSDTSLYWEIQQGLVRIWRDATGKQDGYASDSIEGMLSRAEFASLFRGLIALARSLSVNVDCRNAGVYSTQDLPLRDVCASRMSRLLGVSDMFPDAQAVVLTHDGKSQSGVVMSPAQGTPFSELLEQSMQPGALPLQYSQNALDQLAQLQWIDALFGNVNRQPSDLLFRYHDVQGVRILTSVTAANNQVSFGLLQPEQILEGVGSLPPLQFTAKGREQLQLPYLNQHFVNRMLLMTPEMIDYALAGMLSDAERQAVKQRLEGLQEVLLNNLDAIQHFMELPRSEQGSSFFAQDNIYFHSDLLPYEYDSIMPQGTTTTTRAKNRKK